ncbi:hypothetical protein [Methanobacterium ferruginis]|uniref:hypothetical protein n=1 Tax=Methanobacterium ferruginis TaxID=710191 RepID=UPI00257276BD|nr:hypothetical protein [Methanobacterium ferruginis]BDZ68578.1 hypothetical protein GCM10025860_20260 [Methanobacterium ferruginis]
MVVIPADVLLIAAGLGAFLQVWQMDGYNFGIFWENGTLQMGIIMTFVTGIGGAILALLTGLIPLTGNLKIDLLIVFFTAFMIPFAIDRFITKSSIGNTETTEDSADAA